MSERLRLQVDPAAVDGDDDGDLAALHFYESSLEHAVTGEPLVSVIALGRGMRLTRDQTVELRDWLSEWLAEVPAA